MVHIAPAAALAAFLYTLVAAASGAVNPLCSNALEISIGELYSLNSQNQQPTPISCGDYKDSYRGVWFHYKGEGLPVTMNTCDSRTDFATFITVFTSCDDTSGNVDRCIKVDDGSCGGHWGKATFVAKKSQDYYIFVAGDKNETGNLYFASSYAETPANSRCDKAQEVPEQYPYKVQDYIWLAPYVYAACRDTQTMGLWYKVMGNGKPFVAIATPNKYSNVTVDVYAQCTEDGAGKCITTSNSGKREYALVSWQSVPQQEYWIFVSTDDGDFTTYFELTIEQRSANPHSYCDEPIEITSLPFYHTGKTDYVADSYSECQHSEEAKMLYYRMAGNGRKVIVSTCTNTEIWYNKTELEVYGGCDAATHRPDQCLKRFTSYCETGDRAVFDATDDAYYIAVATTEAMKLQGETFELSVVPYDEANNTQCWYAKEITALPAVLVGTTAHNDPTIMHCNYGTETRRGAWFSYTHADEDGAVTASTCNAQNELNARIEVYQKCINRGCIDLLDSETPNCTKVTFLVERGETYSIFVTAEDPSAPGASFHVDLYREEFGNHSKCEDAYLVDGSQLPYRLEDNTMLARKSYSPCENEFRHGVWVLIVGNGNTIVATAHDNKQIELYDQCPKDQTKGKGCIGSNKDALEFESTRGAHYWLFVTGSEYKEGNFVLDIYEKKMPTNSHCQHALGIPQLPYYNYGLTAYSDRSLASCRNIQRKGNWYEYKGRGKWVTLSTCNIETNFTTEIEVYLGCDQCGGQSCVDVEHTGRCGDKSEVIFFAYKSTPYYIYVTSGDEAGASVGFFGFNATESKTQPELLVGKANKNSPPHSFGSVGVAVSALAVCGVAVVVAAIAIAIAINRKRRRSYQQIAGTTTATATKA